MNTKNKNNSIESIREYLNRLSKEDINNLFSTNTDTKPKKKKRKQPSGTITWKHIQSR